MSNALAIAGVTAVLQSLLGSLRNDLVAAMNVDITLSSLAPEDVAQDKNSPPCLNLFLYQVTPNAALRNSNLASVNAAGARVTRPSLALDLHYLLTAYGSADLQAEVLLGYGMQVFHENPVLTRDTVRSVLNPAVPPPAMTIQAALTHAGLADQLELVKLSLSNMNLEELSKLWTALKANFRPSAAYQATVVLIDSGKAATAALPVLSRGTVVAGSVLDPVTHLPISKRESGVQVQGSVLSPFAQIDSFELSSQQPAAVPGDTLTLSGHSLAGIAGQYRLLLSNPKLGISLSAIGPEVAASASDQAVSFVLAIPANSPAGIYSAIMQLNKVGVAAPQLSNVVSLTVAPRFAANPLPTQIALGGASTVTLHPQCLTELRPNQNVSLILGNIEVTAEPFTTPTTTPSFVFNGLQPGKYQVRLRVDGIDSLFIDRSQSPAVFIGPQLTVTP